MKKLFKDRFAVLTYSFLLGSLKTKFMALSFFVLLSNFFSFSQTFEQGKVLVIIKDESCFPITGSRNTNFNRRSSNNLNYVQTSNSRFNQVLQQFQVSKMVQTMSFAKTKELRNLYELTTPLNENDLFNALNNINSNLFLSVEKVALPISLYEPTDYMWTAYADDWLWHLKKIEADKAWDLTLGDPNVKIAVLDSGVDENHPDLMGKLNPPYDFYDGTPFSTQNQGHGTSVCTTLAGETAEQGTVANGQLASIGFNCRMMFSTFSNGVAKSVYASSVLGAKIISLSWFTICSPTTSYLLAEQEILNNGTAIVRAAGNGDYHCGGQKVYPFSGYEDGRTIIISSTGLDDKHVDSNTNPPDSHSHYSEVDLCAPGYCIMTGVPTSGTDWPYYGCKGGTSFATPIVSGTIGLMLSVNPCLNNSLVQDILKITADLILDASNFPGSVGAGRINAFKAVREAKSTYSPNLDLYIKDRPEDLGRQDFPYHWQADRDESPDIWVRNQQDGLNNQIHQEPEYQSSAPVWVYVKVRNKSCVASTGEEQLSLYWSKAASWSSWPQYWDGSQPNTGNKIETINIPILAPGEDTIIKFQWNILNPYIHDNWGSCLLARIENSPTEPITIYPGRFDDDIFYNNNVALRNVIVTDILPGLQPPGNIQGVLYPHGNHVNIGNPETKSHNFDFTFGVDERKNGSGLSNEFKIKLIFDNKGWEILSPYLINNGDVEIIKEKEIYLLRNSLNLKNIFFEPNTMVPLYVGFEIINQNIESVKNLTFHFRQFMTSSDQPLGGVHFEVNYEKNGENTTIVHRDNPIIENPNKIIRVSPNPADNQVKIDYVVIKGSQAKLMLIDEARANYTEYLLDVTKRDIELNVSDMQVGNYTLALIVDGIAQDSKSLLITP